MFAMIMSIYRGTKKNPSLLMKREGKKKYMDSKNLYNISKKKVRISTHLLPRLVNDFFLFFYFKFFF